MPEEAIRLSLASELGPEGTAALREVLITERLARRQQIFEMGEPADHLYFLVEGKIKLTKPATGSSERESLLWLFGPGDMFGELSLIDRGLRATTATTVTPCTLLVGHRDALVELMDEYPELSRAFMRRLAARLRHANDRMAGLVLADVSGRLAALLLYLGRRFGTLTPAGIEIPRDLTQAELGTMVGASRERVNRTLTEFTSREWIDLTHKSIVLREPAKLMERMH